MDVNHVVEVAHARGNTSKVEHGPITAVGGLQGMSTSGPTVWWAGSRRGRQAYTRKV
jgi:hypothetical protein